METSDLARKLRINPHYHICIVSAPPQYRSLLDPLPENVTIEYELTAEYDLIHAFVRWQKDLPNLFAKLKKHLRKDGLIWVSYPKTTSGVETDLNRDKLFELGAQEGVRAVSQVAVDEVWSAMRFKLA